jgi:prolyl-tRNA synthetase
LRQAGLAVEVDINLKSSLGFRINDWELQGVPLRLEVGARELADKQVKFSRRDTFEKGSIPLVKLTGEVKNLLEKIQDDMYAKSLALRDSLTVETDSYEQFKKILIERKSFIRVPWCETRACETKIKEETKATPRVLELSRIEENISGKCFHCGMPAKRRWLFAHSY